MQPFLRRDRLHAVPALNTNLLVPWVDIALFRHDKCADQIGPEAQAATEERDYPTHPNQRWVYVKILRNAAAHAGQHFVRALSPV